MAEAALPAFGTDALKGVHAVDAGPSVPTGATDAVVNICGGHLTFIYGEDKRHVRAAAAKPGQLDSSRPG